MIRLEAFFLIVAALALVALGIIPTAASANLAQVTLSAVDANNKPVVFPTVFSISTYGNVTAQNGLVTVSLVEGENYHVLVYVYSVQVGEANFNVVGTMDIPIACQIYTLTVDLGTQLAANAGWSATVIAGAGVFQANISTAGLVVFGQVPATTVKVTVFNETDEPVGFGVMNLTRNEVINISPVTIFSMAVRVSDMNGNPVADATVQVEDWESNETLADGSNIFYMQEGDNNVAVTYLGVQVSEGTVLVEHPTLLTLNVSVSALKILLIDEVGKPIANKPLIIKSGDAVLTPSTDGRGYVYVPQLPYGTITLQWASDTIPTTVPFPIPPANATLTLFTHPLIVQVDPLTAYMLGYLTVKVTVQVGDFVDTNALVSSQGIRDVSTQQGYAVLRIPILLDPNPIANVTVKAYGITFHQSISAESSPLVLFMLPTALLPIIAWRLMTRRYKKLRVPLA